MSPPLQRWARQLGIVATALLSLVVVVVGLLQLPPVATWVGRRLLTLLPLNPGYHLDVARVSGDWIHGLQLEGARLRRGDRELARIDRLRLAYDPRRLRGAETHLRALVVDGAQVVARRENGSWDLAQALRRSADTTGGGAFVVDRVDLRDVQLAAQLSPDSAIRVRSLTLRGRGLVLGRRVLFTIDDLGAAIAPPGSGRWFSLATRGALAADEIRLDPVSVQTEQSDLAARVVLPRGLEDPRQVDRLDVRLTANPLALADLAAVAPAVRPDGVLHLEASARGGGGGRLVTAHLAARLDKALLTLDGGTTLLRGRPAAYRARGAVRRLDPARLLRAAPAGDVNAELDADLRGPTLRESKGSIGLRLAKSRIGAQAVERLDLQSALDAGRAEVALRGALAETVLRADGWVQPFDSVPSYELNGNARRPPGTDALARRLAGADAEGEPVLDVGFRVRGAGTALAKARMAGRLNLMAARPGGVQVPLGRATFALAASRLELRPELLLGGGRITAAGVVRLGDTLSYEVRRGTIDRVDVGRLLGDTVVAPLSGRFTLRGRGTAPAHAAADARLELDTLRYGTRQIDAVVATARLRDGRALTRMRGALQGGRFAIDAEGRPFDSTAAFTVRQASLEHVDLGTLLGRPGMAGPVSLTVRATGRTRGDSRSLLARVTLEPSRLGPVDVTGGVLTAELRDEQLRYDAAIGTSGGALALAGDGLPRAVVPSFAVRRGRADSLDLGRLLGRPDLPTNLTARFTASVTGASLDSLLGGLEVELLPSRVRQAELHDGRLALSLERGAISGDVRFAGPDGELSARLMGKRGANAMDLGTDGTLRLEHLAHWTGRPDADGRFESRFALQGATDSAGLRMVGGTLTGSGAIGDVRLDPLHLALTPDSTAIRLDTLIVRSNVALLGGAGRFPLRESAGSDTLRIEGTVNDPAPLTALFGADTLSLDSARVALTVAGPAARHTFDGRADAHRVFVGGNLAGRVTLGVSGALDTTRLSALAGELRLEDGAFGRMRVSGTRVTARYDSVVALEATATVNDSVRIAAALHGTATRDTTRAVLERLDIGEWSLDHPAGVTARPRIEIDSFALRAGDRRVLVDGVLDRHGQSDLTLRLDRVDLDLLRELGISPVPGRLDGQLHLAGTGEAPMIEGNVGLTVRRRTGQEVGQIRTDLRWSPEGLRIDATAAPRQGGRLTIGGTLPIRFALTAADTLDVSRGTTDSVSLAMRADRFDLGFFEPLLPPESARALRGRLALDVHVGGTLGAPRADGRFSLDTAGVTLPALELTYRDGQLAGQLEGDRVRIDRLRLLTGKNEELTGRGTVLLRPLDSPTVDLSAQLRDFRISNSDQLSAIASGQVRLQGTPQAPAVTGQLRLGRTDVFVGAEAAKAQVEQVELTPADRRQVLRQFGPAAIREAQTSAGLMARVRLDVGLDLPNRVWIRRRATPVMDIELSGRMRLRQEPGGSMQFFGSVHPVPDRSTLEVSGRQFRITAGDIRLDGPVEASHLDVNAEYQVATPGGPDQEPVLVEVHAVGRPDSLALTFTSDPSMSQEDILSYIVTGRPASDNPLTAQEAGGAGLGEQIAVGQLSQAISSRAGEGLGFDVFQIRQQGAQGLTLTAGRYLGSRLFLDLQLPLQLLDTRSSSTSAALGPGFELDYTLRRWLRSGFTGGSLPTGFWLRGRRAY